MIPSARNTPTAIQNGRARTRSASREVSAGPAASGPASRSQRQHSGHATATTATPASTYVVAQPMPAKLRLNNSGMIVTLIPRPALTMPNAMPSRRSNQPETTFMYAPGHSPIPAIAANAQTR